MFSRFAWLTLIITFQFLSLDTIARWLKSETTGGKKFSEASSAVKVNIDCITTVKDWKRNLLVRIINKSKTKNVAGKSRLKEGSLHEWDTLKILPLAGEFHATLLPHQLVWNSNWQQTIWWENNEDINRDQSAYKTQFSRLNSHRQKNYKQGRLRLIEETQCNKHFMLFYALQK